MSTGITQNIYPVGLILKGHPCLIVGGGNVAARKADGLLEAEAAVTVISPELDNHLVRLAASGNITHIARAYAPDDTAGYALVFAATGDRKVNRAVLEECRAKRIPCCPVDGNWMDGDFVTPATIRKGPLSVAISTGGQSCRRSRLIKESLARHLDMVDSADLVVMGTSHQQLDLQEREPLQLQGEKLMEVGGMLMHVWGLHEFMLLSTCNRIELLAVKAHGQGTGTILRKILGFDALPANNVYVKKGAAAFEHTALLAAGLLSQVTGENHIVAQIKEALAVASQNQWAGGMLHEWIAAALHISKEIRQALPQDGLQGEIEDAAIQYLQNHPIASKRESHPLTITVIGTGTMGTGIVKRFADLGIRSNWIYHQNKPETIPTGTTLHPWHNLTSLLSQSDCIITAVAANVPIVTNDMAALFANRSVLLIDLATPRNIATTLAAGQTQLLDLDGLKRWQACESGTWDALRSESRRIVNKHRTMYDQIMRSFPSE